MTEGASQHADRYAVLRIGEFRALLGARVTSALAMTALATVVGLQVYEVSRDPLALGLLGLVEAIPALSLALIGGHIADRHDRRRIVMITEAIMVACVVLLALIAMNSAGYGIAAILVVIFASGVAGGFSRPAMSAFEQQVIPLEHAATGQSWASSVWQSGAILGPLLGGLVYDRYGASTTYLVIAVLLALSVGCIALIKRKPMPKPPEGESIVRSLAEGVRYVLRNQVLAGSMALDLFAVLFGGAMALLPIFATDILGVGATGLGLLRTAPSIGALLVMLLATRNPPTKRAGRNLLLCVAGFGVSMMVFALSQSFVLSMVALFFSGVTDGISMIIRGVIVRVMSPEHMRGRIASVSLVFIGASNELGAFESGIAARLLGVVPAVFWGGVAAIGVVAITAIAAPKLRRLNLDQHQIEEDAALVAAGVIPGEATAVQPAK